VDADTLALLGRSLRRVLGEASDRPLSARLDELGWGDAVADDAPTALRTLFELKGEMCSSDDALGPRLGSVVAEVLGAKELAGAAVVLPASLHPDQLSTFEHGATSVQLTGVAVGPYTAGSLLLVPMRDPAGATVLAVVASRADLVARPVGAMDPQLGLVRVEGRVRAADVGMRTGIHAEVAWIAAVAAGRWALSAELVGLARHVIAQAVEYAGAREQYGRAIGTFQAVQHRLASAHAAIVGASAVVAEAAVSGSPWVAMVAKAAAGRAAEEACTQAQQVYGAIGFTWEHEFHRFLRRVYVLDRLFGDWRTLEVEIGMRLQSTGQVPRIGAL
jgi:hypothetical protein